MQGNIRPRSVAALCACVTGVFLAATAARAYDGEYVFGDSLSDNGNAAEYAATIAHTGYLYPPSYHDAWTNGAVAVALLAQSKGLGALEPSLWANGFSDVNNIFGPGFVPGTNYAFAGATASPSGTIAPGANLPQQVSAYTALVSSMADPSALYVIMIGGNDVILTALSGLANSVGDTLIMGSVSSETSQITTLAGDGARNFLIVNVPNVGLIPYMTQDNPSDAAAATAYSQFYDTELNMQLAGLSLPIGTKLNEFDLYDFNRYLLDNAGLYGFTNTTDPCFTDAPYSSASTLGCSIANVNDYVYWNDVHPSGAVRALWADGMEAALAPEPSTWAMALIGFAGIGFMGLRSARTGRAA